MEDRDLDEIKEAKNRKERKKNAQSREERKKKGQIKREKERRECPAGKHEANEAVS